MINVDSFLQNRFPSLYKRPLFFKGISRILKRIFHENEFVAFEKKFPHLVGLDFVDQALRYFGFSYSTFNTEKERIPKTGRVVIIANHPIGSLDGLALLSLVSEVRRDVKVVANDILAAIKPLQPMLLAVDNMGGKTAKENIRDIYNHLEAEGALIIFPAGAVSRVGPSGIKDGEWNPGFLKFASKTHAPILPIYVDGRNSAFFYSVSIFAKPLSTLLLVDEMFKQTNKYLNIRIGNPIRFQNYNQVGKKIYKRAKLFKHHVYSLQSQNKGLFDEVVAVAHPEDRQQLMTEIRKCEVLGQTSDGKTIYLYKLTPDSAIMREIGRLREISFRAVGEGTGKRRDFDGFDTYYDHIVLWDNEGLEIVGSYRVGNAKKIIAEHGKKGLYTHRLYDYQEPMEEIFEQGLELGRSFVQPSYWGKRSLDYLWFGIGAYIKRYPDIRYLFGAVSISDDFNEAAKATLVHVYEHYFKSDENYAYARIQFNSEDKSGVPVTKFVGDSYKKDFASMKGWLANQNLSVPTMYKQYFNLFEEGGAIVVDFSIDPDFSNCVDGLIIADLLQLKQSKRERYIPAGELLELDKRRPPFRKEIYIEKPALSVVEYSAGRELTKAFEKEIVA